MKAKIFEQGLYSKENKEVGKVAIIIGGLEVDNPKIFMDSVVREYVGNEPYFQCIDMHLDNPWVRVIISGINKVDYDDFNNQHL